MGNDDKKKEDKPVDTRPLPRSVLNESYQHEVPSHYREVPKRDGDKSKSKSGGKDGDKRK